MLMSDEEFREIRDKAKLMAKADMTVNGCYLNAPYRIQHTGEQYIVRLKSSASDGHDFLVVERPMKQILTTGLD